MTVDLSALPWRTGRTLGRTVYARTGGDDYRLDIVIGMMDTPELAEEACAAHNAELACRNAEDPAAGTAPDRTARAFALLCELEQAVALLDRADAGRVMGDVSCFETDWWGSNG